MDDAGGKQPVLRCGQCNKPFDKPSTLKRHSYYCRSRRATGRLANRPRSCISCAQGKAGCDKQRPQCSRCSTKDIKCEYPETIPAKPWVTSPENTVDAPAKETDQTSVSMAASPALQITSCQIILDEAPSLPNSEISKLGSEFLDWVDTDITLGAFLETDVDDSWTLLGPEPSDLPHLEPTTQLNASLGSQDSFHHPQSWESMQLMPTIPYTPSLAIRSLVYRHNMRPSLSRPAALILHILKSYPVAMLRYQALPPFIHPSLLSFSFDGDDMEPLSNCISLVHMISSSIRGSHKLFWKNVGMECERFYATYESLSKWELLAALHALSIYTLIRLKEGETDNNNYDAALMRTIIVIAQQLSREEITCHTQCALCNKGIKTCWKEWIFRESRRRLAIVYRVVNMLAYFEPGGMCQLPEDLVLAPLPASKQLWEAKDEAAWSVDLQKGHGLQESFGLAKSGDIVRLDQDRLSCSDAWLSSKHLGDGDISDKNIAIMWEDWCSGMDGFGGLILLAASLIE